MARPTVQAVGQGCYRVEGDLTYATVTTLRSESRNLFATAAGELEFDLGGVERADSAGLALLIDWMRSARAAGGSLRFRAMPSQMRAIAEVSDLDEVLPLAD